MNHQPNCELTQQDNIIQTKSLQIHTNNSSELSSSTSSIAADTTLGSSQNSPAHELTQSNIEQQSAITLGLSDSSGSEKLTESIPNDNDSALNDAKTDINLNSEVQVNIEESHTIIEIPAQETPINVPTQAFSIAQTTVLQSLLTSLRRVPEVEQKLIILRALIFCALMGSISLICMLSADENMIPYHTLMIIAYCYLAFFIVENAIRVQCSQRTAWSIREDILNIGDAITGIIVLTCMKYPSAITVLAASVSCGMLPIIYPLFTKTVQLTKVSGTIFRLLYAVQAPIIILKLAGYINYDWRVLLIATWLVILASLPHMLFFSLSLVYQNLAFGLKYFIYREFYYADRFRQFCLGFWLLGYSLLSNIFGVYIFINSQILQELNAYDLLHAVSIVGLILSLALLAGAGFMLSIFKEYAVSMSFTHMAEAEEDEELQTEDDVTSNDAKVSFEAIKQTKYFIRSSGCYFTPLTANDLSKRQEKVQDQTSALSKKQDQSENASLCYVCCASLPDSVMMNCGHGGVCFNCAQTHLKKKQECMECRARVQALAITQLEAGQESVFRSDTLVKIFKHVETAPVVKLVSI